MRTEEWIRQEKARINKGFKKIDTAHNKAQEEFNGIASNCDENDAHKLSYCIGKMRKLSEEKMQNRGKIKLINKILEEKS